MNTTSLIESKLLYIRQWQSLPEFGVSHFVVKFRGSKKEVRYLNRGVGPGAQRLKSVVVLEFLVGLVYQVFDAAFVKPNPKPMVEKVGRAF